MFYLVMIRNDMIRKPSHESGRRGKAKRARMTTPKCTVDCNHSNCEPFSWIEAKSLNQVSGDSTEGWEVKYFDSSLDDKGLDRAGYYREEWGKCKEREEDNFTTPKPKPLGPGMKQHLKKLEEGKQKKNGEMVQTKDPEEVEQEKAQEAFIQAMLDEFTNKTWWKTKNK